MEFKQFHQQGNNNPATVRECSNGGRILHWLPYKSSSDTTDPKDYIHIYTNQSQIPNAWFPGQPNDRVPVCVQTYLGKNFLVLKPLLCILNINIIGLEAEKSWYGTFHID